MTSIDTLSPISIQDEHSRQLSILEDPDRLALLLKLDLVDSPSEEIFDRLTRLASHLLPAPVALVSLVDDKRQYFKSFVGLTEPWLSRRETPLSHSFCQHVVTTGQPLIVENAPEHPLVHDNLAVSEIGVMSYLGMPLTMNNGHTLGSFCVIDSHQRPWSDDDIAIMKDLARSVLAEIELRNEVLDLQESEKKRTQLVKELQASNQDLADFAYIVSHDLKAPLRGIHTVADWLAADYADVLDEDGQELLELLMRRVARLQDLIRGVLRYSRLGKMDEGHELVDLSTRVQFIIESLAPPDHINIHILDPLPEVWGSPIRLEQLFQNLLSNAIKFMDKSEGKIEISCRELPNCWEFTVRDNGPGIEEKYYQKIFKMFQTLNARDDVESTGIGLTLVKKIVELHGGTIEIQSAMGEGSSFIFTLAKVGA